MPFDGEHFGGEVAKLVKEYVQRENAKLSRRIDELERRQMKFVGVWRAGQSYEPGSLATHSGSLWHANRSTAGSRPGTDDSWVLAVKRGDAT
jgi:hypothetical protein